MCDIDEPRIPIPVDPRAHRWIQAKGRSASSNPFGTRLNDFASMTGERGRGVKNVAHPPFNAGATSGETTAFTV